MPLFLYLMTTSLIVIMANSGTQLMSLLDGSIWANDSWTAESPGSKRKEDTNTSPIVPENSVVAFPHKAKVQTLPFSISEEYGNDKKTRKKVRQARFKNPLISVNHPSTYMNFDKKSWITRGSDCQDLNRTCDKNATSMIKDLNCTFPNADFSCYKRSDSTKSRAQLERFPKYQRRSAEYPLKVHIFLARRPLFGRRYSVFATMPALGNEKFVLNLTVDTNNYFIDEIVTKPGTKPSEWQYTKNLGSELRKKGLGYPRLPYTSCYFYRARASFYKSDHKFVIARVSSYSDRSQLLAAEARRKITVRKPPGAACMPIFSLRICENPDYPMAYWRKSHLVFFAVVTGDCGDIRYGPTRWDLYDLREKNLLKHVDVTNHFVMSLPAYFEYKAGVILLLRACAKINNVVTVARCYLRYIPPKLDVRIVGNERRKVDVRKEIIIDGSNTRNIAMPTQNLAAKKFVWGCRSKDDPTNKYCRSHMSDSPVMRLPKNALRRGFHYIITLNVSSGENPGVIQTARQLLLGVSANTITPDIWCMQNCAYGVYAPDKSIQLRAECSDCDEPIVRYEWWVRTSKEGSKETLLSKKKMLIIYNSSRKLFIQLRVKLASKLSAEAFQTLLRNEGPKNGSCAISPNSGIQTVTPFRISCGGFETPFGPLLYRYVMPPLGLIGQSMHARYVASLTEAKEVSVRICDALDMCVSQTLDVDVQPFKFNNPEAEPEELIEEVTRNVPDLIKRGFWNEAMTRSIGATLHIKNADHGHQIYASLAKEVAFSAIHLERLAVLATKFVYHLDPMDHKGAHLLSQVFWQISIIFRTIVVHHDRLHPDAYYSLTAMHMYYMSTLGLTTESHPMAMCTVHDPECHNIKTVSLSQRFDVGFDPMVLVKINQWKMAMWNLYECVLFLGIVASQQKNPYDDAVTVVRGGITYQMNITEVNDPIEALALNTVDNTHRLVISAKLLAELRTKLDDKTILFQIISQQNHHNSIWWYPHPMPAKTSVLIVNAYSPRRFLSEDDSDLENPVVFRTNISKFSEDETFNKLTSSGSIVHSHEVHYYSLLLPYKAMLAVRIVSCSEPINIEMRLNRRPTRQELIAGSCLITPAMKGKRVWLANECKLCLAFVSICRSDFLDNRFLDDNTIRSAEEKAKSPLNYSILLEIHECTQFSNLPSGPSWSADNCTTSFEHSHGTKVHCTCRTLGVLGTRIFPILAHQNVLFTAPLVLVFHWVVTIFFLLLFLLLCCILINSFGFISANQKLVNHLDCDGRKFKVDPYREIKREILIVIVTGGQEFAGTTSNLKIYLKSPHQPQNMFQIPQDPGHPRLLRNTTNMIMVPKGSIKIPTRLALGIEPNGRYPSWYCRTVTIIDLRLKRHQLFVVERWFKRGHTSFMRSKYFTIDGKRNTSSPQYTWWRRFHNRCQELYISWFYTNPITGPWQNTIGGWTMSGVQRTAVLVSKLAITTTVVSVYYGTSTEESIEVEQIEYDSNSIHFNELLAMSIFSFLCAICVHIFFELLVLRILLTRE